MAEGTLASSLLIILSISKVEFVSIFIEAEFCCSVIFSQLIVFPLFADIKPSNF
jgi:hypothetical protein